MSKQEKRNCRVRYRGKIIKGATPKSHARAVELNAHQEELGYDPNPLYYFAFESDHPVALSLQVLFRERMRKGNFWTAKAAGVAMENEAYLAAEREANTPQFLTYTTPESEPAQENLSLRLRHEDQEPLS